MGNVRSVVFNIFSLRCHPSGYFGWELNIRVAFRGKVWTEVYIWDDQLIHG